MDGYRSCWTQALRREDRKEVSNVVELNRERNKERILAFITGMIKADSQFLMVFNHETKQLDTITSICWNGESIQFNICENDFEYPGDQI